MDELSAVWYSGFHWNVQTQDYRQTKAAVAVVVLNLCGFVMVVVGFTENNSQMRTGGFTMFGLGLLTLVCLCFVSYFKQMRSSRGAMQRNQTSMTESAERIEFFLSGRRNFSNSMNNDIQRPNLSTSRFDINFLLSRVLGSPPTYEEVTTNADFEDTATGTDCAPPPYYTDLSDDEGLSVNGNTSPPPYESSIERHGIETSEV